MRFTEYHLLFFSSLASLYLQLLVWYEDDSDAICSTWSGTLKRTAGIVRVANARHFKVHFFLNGVLMHFLFGINFIEVGHSSNYLMVLLLCRVLQTQ